MIRHHYCHHRLGSNLPTLVRQIDWPRIFVEGPKSRPQTEAPSPWPPRVGVDVVLVWTTCTKCECPKFESSSLAMIESASCTRRAIAARRAIARAFGRCSCKCHPFPLLDCTCSWSRASRGRVDTLLESILVRNESSWYRAVD